MRSHLSWGIWIDHHSRRPAEKNRSGYGVRAGIETSQRSGEYSQLGYLHGLESCDALRYPQNLQMGNRSFKRKLLLMINLSFHISRTSYLGHSSSFILKAPPPASPALLVRLPWTRGNTGYKPWIASAQTPSPFPSFLLSPLPSTLLLLLLRICSGDAMAQIHPELQISFLLVHKPTHTPASCLRSVIISLILEVPLFAFI